MQFILGGVAMQTYPIEVEPEQIIHWLMVERQVAPSELRVSARRAIETRELPTRKEFRLGEEERDDLSEIATVGTLQIAPAHAAEGWLVTIVVEDEFGPRILDESKKRAKENRKLASPLFTICSFVLAGAMRAPLQKWGVPSPQNA